MSNPFSRDEQGNVFVNLGSFGGKVSIYKLLGVDGDLLSEVLSEQPDLYFKTSRLLSHLMAEKRTKKLERDVFAAHLAVEIRNEGGKLTEKSLEEKIIINGSYQNFQKEIIELERMCDMVTGLVKAMEQKKDVLISLSSNYREELRQQMSPIANKIDKEVE